MALIEKTNAGRPQESALTGPTFRLAEFLNSVWDSRVGKTNQELAQEWNYRAAGIVSMWRTGKSRIPIEKLPDIARLVKEDLARLLPLWLEQYTGKWPTVTVEISKVFERLASNHEHLVLRALRKGATYKAQFDPIYTARQIQAIEQIAADDRFANFVLDEALKQGLIKELEDED